MKKLFLFAAIAALGLAACNKAELADNNLPVQKAPATNFRYANDDDWGCHRVWSDAKEDCEASNQPNCWDDIIVTPDNVFVSTISTGNYKNIVGFAKDNYELLSQFMTAADLNGLIEGKLIPSSKEKEDKIFLFLKDGESKLVATYPFVIK